MNEYTHFQNKIPESRWRKVNGIENLLDEIIEENFPNLGSGMATHVQEVIGPQIDKRSSFQCIIAKLSEVQDRD